MSDHNLFEVKHNSKALSAQMRQRIEDIRKETLRAEHASAEEIRRTAQKLSSGGVPKSYLARQRRKRGHGLYSRAAPAPPQDPAIINAQTSRLKRSWRVYVRWMKDGTSITLWNTAPYAKYMRGTKWMIARPTTERVAQLVRRTRLKRLIQARDIVMQKSKR